MLLLFKFFLMTELLLSLLSWVCPRLVVVCFRHVVVAVVIDVVVVLTVVVVVVIHLHLSHFMAFQLLLEEAVVVL